MRGERDGRGRRHGQTRGEGPKGEGRRATVPKGKGPKGCCGLGGNWVEQVKKQKGPLQEVHRGVYFSHQLLQSRVGPKGKGLVRV